MEIYLFRGLALGIAAAATPGLFQTFLINRTLHGGWRSGVPIVFAPLVSDIPIVTLILLILNQIPATFLRWISLLGGIFALYLAWSSLREWRANIPESLKTNAPATRKNGFWQGVLMNSLSPGPYTFWTLVNGPLLLTALRQSFLSGTAFLLGFYGMFIGGMLVIVVVFHQASRLGPHLVRWLSLVSIAILAMFGIVLLLQAILGQS